MTGENGAYGSCGDFWHEIDGADCPSCDKTAAACPCGYDYPMHKYGVLGPLCLHRRLTSQLVGVIGDDGEVQPASEAEAIFSTEAFCGECRKPWPCPTVQIGNGDYTPSEPS